MECRLIDLSFLTVNYDTKNFSISQAIAAPDSASHIVAISNASAISPTPTNLPPIVKTNSTNSPKSSSISTGAKAGIAIAIVLIALIVGGVLLWFYLKKRRGRSKTQAEELPADPIHPRDRAELPDSGADRYSGSTMVKGAGTNVDEKDQERVHQQEVALMTDPVELSGPDRSELPSPDPEVQHELASPDLPPRSELSTPEPRAEISSAVIGGTAAGAPSLSQENLPSPVSSPDSLRPRNRVGSQQKPAHVRKDSSESEGGWTRAQVPKRTRPTVSHSRVVSSESEGWTREGMVFTTHHRMDSSDSEISVPITSATSSRPPHNRAPSADSDLISSEKPPTSATSSRPPHRRLDSNDSSDTIETRFQMSPMSPYFPSNRQGNNQPIQAIPSLGLENSLSALSSPTLMSTRSGLLSPEPMEIDEKDETEEVKPAKRK